MKKLHIVFVLVLSFLYFNITHAESLIIPSTDTIDEYLEYRSGCSDSNFFDCYRANSIENNAWSDVRSILNQIPKNTLDRRVEDIKKAREKLDKDNDENYKQLQAELKSLSASINTQPIGYSAQEEYEYQLRVYELKSELACMDKEGYYSSFNKKTKECECVEGSTFINGKCENELRLRLDNLFMCVQSFGPLAYYNYEKAGCVCYEGSEFDFNNNNGLCTEKGKPLAISKYIPVAERQDTPKASKTPITTLSQAKPVLGAKTTEEMALKPEIPVAQPAPVFVQDNPTPANQKTTFWQRLKNTIWKIKFW